ncbi:hypothetical protein DID88_007366 [Monilinia fructigena]|uniref:Uncharacterized protein n=1 Tax=Monilinia fructigena TaxID=38457 RepID=A0A395J847_9HELO|nr:hypothetical protein DID88_007366 [Monilinia fructigena]
MFDEVLTVAELVEEETTKTYNRDGNIRKSHLLCIDALTYRHKPLLMLSKKFVNSHPLKTAEIKFTPPNIAQQLEGWRKLLEGHPSKTLTLRDTTVRPINDTVNNNDLIEEKYGETNELSAEHNGETKNYEEDSYNKIAVMAGQNPGKKAYLTNVEWNDKSFTMAEAKIIYGFLYFMKRNRFGLSNLMNIYLDRMDMTPEFNDVDMVKMTKGLMAMEMGGIVGDIDEATSSSPSPKAPSSTHFSSPPVFKSDADSTVEPMKSRKRRKIVEEEE